MHFHLPKPLHGWREFAGEVGIIVVGVLIALAAEQVVEELHWRSEGHKALESLRQEMGDHFDDASEAMIAAPCIDRQLQLLEARLTRSGPYQPAPLFQEPSQGYTVRAPSRLWPDTVWHSIGSEGVVSHLDPELRMSLSNYYSQVPTMRANSDASFLINQRLRLLAQPLQLDPATRARLVEEIEEDRGRATFGALVASQLLRMIRELHMTPPRAQLDLALGNSGTIKFCRGHGLPLGNNTAVY